MNYNYLKFIIVILVINCYAYSLAIVKINDNSVDTLAYVTGNNSIIEPCSNKTDCSKATFPVNSSKDDSFLGLNKGMLKRTMYLLAATSGVCLLYLALRTCRFVIIYNVHLYCKFNIYYDFIHYVLFDCYLWKMIPTVDIM